MPSQFNPIARGRYPPVPRSDPFCSSFFASNRSVVLRRRRLRRVELPVALLDAASPLVPGNRGADMVRTSALACRSDFLLCLASCQGKNLIVEAQRAALAASGFYGRSALEPSPIAPERSLSSPAPRPFFLMLGPHTWSHVLSWSNYQGKRLGNSKQYLSCEGSAVR